MPNDLPDWSSTFYQPDIALAGSPLAYPSGFSSTVFMIPNGMHILSIVLPGFPNVTLLTVTGVTSGLGYLAEIPNVNISQGQYFAIIPTTVDTEVTLVIESGAAGTAYVSAMAAPMAVAAIAQNPAPWQAANVPPLNINFNNPGNGATAVVIPAQTNDRSIWLHSMSWQWLAAETALSGEWQDSTGNHVVADNATTAGGWAYMSFHGAKLASGASFGFVQTGSTAANTTECRGSIVYAVY